MKIAIITITNSKINYGNALQNCALCSVLKSFGSEVVTLNNTKGSNPSKLSQIKSFIKNIIKIILGRKVINYKKNIKQNLVAFEEFQKKYLQYSASIDFNKLNELLEKYDFFVIGSDQVWNPVFYCNQICWDYLFASFAPSYRKIAYAASISIAEIPKEFQESFIKNVNNISNVSVREEAGAKLIENLTGRLPEVLVDPTLLLSARQWENFANTVEKLPPKYLLTYFLGKVSETRKKDIESIAVKYGLNVVDIMDGNGLFNMKNIGPSEFIYLVKNATVMCTDSFHGSVFSIIFHIPFLIYEREDNLEKMNSRMDTLLGMMNLQSRFRQNIEIDNILKIDFSYSDKKIAEEKKRSMEYLEKNLKKAEEKTKEWKIQAGK